MVGVERFELPTHCSQSSCATRLRYTPKPVNLSMLRTPLFCVNPFPSFWATKNPINSKGHPYSDGLKNNGAPGEITSGFLPSSLRVRFAHANSLQANLSNSYRSNSPVGDDVLDPFRGQANNGAPGEIRTPDRPVRSRVLYPAELRARCVPKRNSMLREGCELSV